MPDLRERHEMLTIASTRGLPSSTPYSPAPPTSTAQVPRKLHVELVMEDVNA